MCAELNNLKLKIKNSQRGTYNASVSLGGISRANYNTANLIKHLNKTALEGIHVLTCSRSDSAKAEKKANIYFTG